MKPKHLNKYTNILNLNVSFHSIINICNIVCIYELNKQKLFTIRIKFQKKFREFL